MGEDGARLQLIFIWHMHQPDYFDAEYGETSLPWTRLHACKGYLDMPLHLEAHPGIRATFNFSGTLLGQLGLVGSADRADRYARLTLKPPPELSYEEKMYIVKHFFSLAPQTIKESRRLFELIGKRGRTISDSAIPEVIRRFTDQDFLDLQVLFNLVWFGKKAVSERARLRELLAKGSGYSSKDKEEVLAIQREEAATALGRYVDLRTRGQAEVSFTPYSHPILPLLIDSACAADGLPGVPLPESFSFPEDARWHVQAGMEAYAKAFGEPPRGMWPAEGGVSRKALELAGSLGVRWVGTDEGILWRSLRVSLPGSFSREDLLYKPYRLEEGGPAIFFRDHYLSDRIGFTYQSMDIGAAVDDFLAYLRPIASRPGGGVPVVTIILDGENPWPYYPDDGAPFLDALYGRIEKEPWIETTTPSRVLEGGAACGELTYLFPGSWIDSNFRIWIGDHAKNRAWTLLAEAHRRVAASGCDGRRKAAALAHLRVAEGSDWFWWYGEPNSSTEDPIFDQLFRSRLRAALSEIGEKVPVALLKPTGTSVEPAPVVRGPLTFIHPGVDGAGDGFFEWYNAGKYEIRRASGEMAGRTPLFSTVFYGFDYDAIYIRMDPLAIPSQTVEQRLQRVQVQLVLDEERERWVEISLPSPVAVKAQGASGDPESIQVAFKRILEVAVPFSLFDFQRGTPLSVTILVVRDGHFIEKYPQRGTFEITVPSENWDKMQWIV